MVKLRAWMDEDRRIDVMDGMERGRKWKERIKGEMKRKRKMAR